MKKSMALLALILVLAISHIQSLAAPVPLSINLVGTWTTITSATTANAKAYTPSGPVYNIRMTMKITDQQGDLFKGTMTIAPPYGKGTADPFTGALVGNKLRLTSNMTVAGGEFFMDGATPKIEALWHAINSDFTSGGPDTGKALFKRTSTTF